MSGNTVTRADLCEAIHQKIGRLSRTECAALVDQVLKEISDCLERGEKVKLSSFGVFVVRKKGQRIGRNPRTGEEVPIAPRRVLRKEHSDKLTYYVFDLLWLNGKDLRGLPLVERKAQLRELVERTSPSHRLCSGPRR